MDLKLEVHKYICAMTINVTSATTGPQWGRMNAWSHCVSRMSAWSHCVSRMSAWSHCVCVPQKMHHLLPLSTPPLIPLPATDCQPLIFQPPTYSIHHMHISICHAHSTHISCRTLRLINAEFPHTCPSSPAVPITYRRPLAFRNLRELLHQRCNEWHACDCQLLHGDVLSECGRLVEPVVNKL